MGHCPILAPPPQLAAHGEKHVFSLYPPKSAVAFPLYRGERWGPFTRKFPLSIHPTAYTGQIAETAQKVNVNINFLTINVNINAR